MPERTHDKSFPTFSLDMRLLMGLVAESLALLREGDQDLHLGNLEEAADLMEEATTDLQAATSILTRDHVSDLRKIFAATTDEELRELGYLAADLRAIQQAPDTNNAKDRTKSALPKVLATREHLAAMRVKIPDTVHLD